MEILATLNSWTHTLTAAICMILGGVILMQTKGTRLHTRLGTWYFYLMLITNVSCLFIYRATGHWFFPHTLAVITLICLIPGYYIQFYKNYRHWKRIHLTCMILSYYMLIGGAINEAFIHIPKLRPYILKNDPVVGICHMIAMTFFVVILIYFFRATRRKKILPKN